MPVYVTHAHVTIGDSQKKKARRPIAPRHVFRVSDIKHTPYCIRTFCVTFFGFIIVGGGVLMTIIGYKPGLILPWYRTTNQSSPTNTTEPSALPQVLGEPGPLRYLVYIGPILMGLGAFAMMVSVVLFCEIKDRYFNNIVPKIVPEQRHKTNIYDKIIEEFRKNYFRGIEVPLKALPRRHSKGRFSFSLSRNGSLMSLGRRLSHDSQKRKRERRSSRDSTSKRTRGSKHKRSIKNRILDSDSWMKTSSLPNIRHKDGSPHGVYDIDSCPCVSQRRTSRGCGPNVHQRQLIDHITTGIDNPAYRSAPPNKRLRRLLTKHASLEHDTGTQQLTTAIVHRESNTKHEPDEPCSFLPELRCRSARGHSHSSKSVDRDFTVIDIDKDIELIPKLDNDNESKQHIHYCNNTCTHPCNPVDIQKQESSEGCTCGTDVYCIAHALGMDSAGSSLSLSSEIIPSEWNDARRNTEPIVFYRQPSNNVSHACVNNDNETMTGSQNVSESSCHQSNSIRSDQSGSINSCKPSATSLHSDKSSRRDTKSADRRSSRSSIFAPFRSKIGPIFKSDSNLTHVGTYSLLRSNQSDNISLDSLNLTDDMLQNFDMTDTTCV